MRFIFEFPDIGEGISEGKILDWYVKKGQKVNSGDNLVKMETDKVVADIPSPKDGTIVACFGNPGDVIQVGDSLVELEIEGVSPEQAQRIAREKPKGKSEQPLEEKGFGVVGTLEVAGDGAFLPVSDEAGPAQLAANSRQRKALATPVARAMARELNVDIHRVIGTGPGGRVTKKDIQDHAQRRTAPISQQPAPSTEERLVEIKEISQIRKTIAKRMVLSKHTAPHMTVLEEVEVSKLVELRQSQKEKFAARGAKLSYLPFIVKAIIEALKQHPILNSQFDGEKGRIIYKHYYNIGIAVDASDGLVVPVIRDADRLSIYDLAVKIAEMAQRARERQLRLEDLQDGTFSITNYGAIAGLHGVPIINYPEVAIIGTGRIRQLPVVHNDLIQIGHILPLSLSVDHRIIDGGQATRFLRDVIGHLADPLAMLLG